jgi:amino acid transporter
MVVFALATTALIWALTHHGVQLSARITALLGGLELLIMLALGITFLIHPGPGSTYLAPLKPSSSPHHFGGILAGMVFSILALSGFEAPAPLAQEARLPGKFIGQAIMLSLGSIGSLLHLYFLCERHRLGHRRHGRLRLQSQSVLRSRPCAMGRGLVVRGSRHHQQRRRRRPRLYQRRVARDVHDGSGGHAPCRFRAYPSYPPDTYIRDRVCADSRNGGNPAGGLVVAPDYIFGFLETIATLAVIVLYVMANLALTRYMRREQRANFTVWQHVVVPWIATLALLPVLFVTVYPEPAWPYNMTPYLFLVSLIVGFALYAVARVAQPRSSSPRRNDAHSQRKRRRW